jgi:hypothetical protein
MAEANPQVMQLIESELKKNPDTSNAELLEKAKKVDKSVGKLTARQFNATYPLQVKRAMKPRKRSSAKKRSGGRKAAGGSRARAAAPNSGRDQVRQVLLDLAKDVANAQGKGDVVDVIAGIDRYVDKVVKAAG